MPPPPSGPLPNYPPPSGYTGGYLELYPGQNQVYPGQPEYNVYPAAPNGQYPYTGNVYSYPEPQQPFSYPSTEYKAKKPQVSTPAPSFTSVLPTGYGSKSTPTSPAPTQYTSSTPTSVRINVPDQIPEITGDYGQKTVVLSKNDLSSPSSGSSGYSSSLTPQYVSPTSQPTKTPYQTGQESNLVVLSSRKPESSTPLYGVSTKSPDVNNNYAEPSSTPSYGEQFTTLAPDSSTPVNIIPYPLPIVPNPGSCPCYFVPPTSNSTDQQQQLQQQGTFDLNNLPEGAVIGFVPVVFYPSCGVASKEALSSKLAPVFPSAYQVPYKCSFCEHSESQTATIRSSFDQVVKPSHFNPPVVVKSPSRKSYPDAPVYDQPEFGRKIRVVRRKSKDEQN